MDYFEEPRELVSNVLKMNPTAGTAVGHDLGTSAMVDVSVGDRAASPPTAHRGADNQRTSDQVDLTC